MKKTVWLSYDLGVRGDYESLYSWLDNHGAKECGNSVAILDYDCVEDVIDELRRDLTRSVSFGKHDRVYVIWRQDGKIKGRFLVGKRKAAPWSGYGSQEPQVDEEA